MAQPRRIVVLHTDAQVCHWLGAMGHPQLRTPNIDALAAQGTLFRQATACNGVCVPSRASLMTGRYPIAHGVTNNHLSLHPDEETMGKRFEAEGFSTGYFGKTHYGGNNQDMPGDGWQDSFLVDDYQAYLDAVGQGWTYPKKQVQANPQVRYWKFGPSVIPHEHYFEKVVTDRAIDWLTGRGADEDFLCFVSYIAPHGPFSPPEPYASMYDPDDIILPPRFAGELDNKPPGFVRWASQNQKYLNQQEQRIFLATVYGLVTLVDDCVGRVVAALKQRGMYENTLIVFASDHGDFGAKYGILGKSWTLDDCLIRIPLVMACPGQPGAQGHVTDELVQNCDIYPTMLDYAGLKKADKTQGQSLLPLVRQQPGAKGRDAAFAYQQNQDSDHHQFQAMIRTRQWKLVQSGQFKGELYDLVNDPHEVHNLIDDPQHGDRVNTMRERLLRWHVENSGHFYHPERARYWEDETHFYNEKVFSGERITNRAGSGVSSAT